MDDIPKKEKIRRSKSKKKSKPDMAKYKINKISPYTQGINITKNIILNDEDIFDNTYQYIGYKDKIFKLDSRNPLRQKKITHKCINKYINKNKPANLKYFCDSTIVALRDSEFIKKN